MYGHASPLLSTNGYSNEVIQGLNFAACANNPQMANAAVQVSGGSNNVVNNVSVKYTAGAGLGVSGTNTQVLNSTFNYNGQEGIASSGATNLLVQNSTTSYNNTLPGKQFSTGWEAGGIKCDGFHQHRSQQPDLRAATSAAASGSTWPTRMPPSRIVS